MIEIDEDYLKIINKNGGNNYLADAVLNGTPLPKGHGRLIDADRLPYEDIESIDGNIYMCVNAYDIDHAPTIIEGSDSE